MTGAAGRWLAAAALWACAAAAGPLAGGWRPSSDAADLVVTTTATLPAISTNSITAAEDGAVLSVTGPDPFVVLAPPSRPVRSVRLDLVPIRSARQDFHIYYVPSAAPPTTAFDDAHVLRGTVLTTTGGWRVQWELPVPIRAYRLDVPDDASFRVVAFEASAREGALATRAGRVARSALRFLLAGLLAFAGVCVVCRTALPDLATIQRLAIAALVPPLGVLIFLLPPFQGPDEDAHWMLALAYSRPGIDAEPAAYRLPAILDPVPIRFKPEVKFDPSRFTIAAPDRPLTTTEFDQRQKVLHDNYPYARPYAYPVVTMVSLLYPHIDGVGEAVLLFYLCRAAAALALVTLLTLACRRFEVPFTAIFFVSLPLVLQQSAIVSADVLLDLGALAAALLYLHHRARPAILTTIVLWAITLAIVSVKFIYAPLLALPLLTIPAGRSRRAVIYVVAALALLLAYPAVTLILREVRAIATVLGRSHEASLQVASLGTASGWWHLLAIYGRYVASVAHVDAWAGPIGWLDTPLGAPHVSLIRVSAAAAVLLDVARYAPVLRIRGRALGFALAFCVAGLGAASFVDVFLYYLMTTSPGAIAVAGVQVRHFFPIAIAGLMLAATPAGAPSRREAGAILRIVALAVFVGLLVLRTILLAQDLLVRYW